MHRNRLREVGLSDHAKRRAKDRDIPTSDIVKVIVDQVETIEVRFGRKASFRHVACFYLVAIYEVQKDKIVVVSVVRVDRRRLRRYGFARV